VVAPVERTGEDLRARLLLRLGLRRAPWSLRIRWDDPEHSYLVEQQSGPFSRWRHVRRFQPDGPDASVLEDTIEYALPGGVPLLRPSEATLHARLQRWFRWSHERLRLDLQRHTPFSERGPLRIGITGASGLIGRNLRAYLATAGHDVFALVRRPPRPGANEICWNPQRPDEAADALQTLDVLIHLAGENVAAGRWTSQRMARIRDSRVENTRRLSRTLATLDRRPRAFICASAVGYYGGRGDEPLDENAAPGEGFLPSVCRAWEAATQPASEVGIRTVNLRIGIVLSPAGGALPRMLGPFRAGLGGPVGGGWQFMSWIALEDLLGAIEFLMHVDDIRGPVNAVAPQPVSNREFAQTLGRVLHRPATAPLPALVVRLLFGRMGRALLLEGCRVVPRVLQRAGFTFLFADLESALRWELALSGAGPASSASP